MVLEHKRHEELGRMVTRFDMGNARLVLDLGHAEYPVPEDPELGLAIITYGADYDNDDRWPEGGLALFNKLVEVGVSNADDAGWTTIATVSGDVFQLGRAFFQLSMDLDPAMDPAGYTPGGDDDTFDYWPSGMRLLFQMAKDLQQLTNGDLRYMKRYRQVLQEAKLLGVPEMEGSVPLAELTPDPESYYAID